jgi:hypothetical protein
MNEANPYHQVFFLGTVERSLPQGRIRRMARELAGIENEASEVSLVVARASELCDPKRYPLPRWVDAETRFLALLDVPEQAILRLPSVLRLHKPDQRLQVCRDEGVVKRLVIALSRGAPWEGVLDAYVLDGALVVLLGDMSVREFPVQRLPKLRQMGPEDLARFEIDSAGSFLYWPEPDIHLGPSQLLQAVDPMYLADIEIKRYEMEKISLVLFDMRTERSFKQTEIEGLSDRHVRRLENEEIRLTVDAAEKLARSFGMGLPEFLDEVSERVSALKSGPSASRPEANKPSVA